MWWMPLVAAGVGLYQSHMQNKAMEQARDQQNRINTYAPLFGIAPKALDPNSPQSNLAGGALGGALSGFNQMQNYNQSEMQNKWLQQQMNTEAAKEQLYKRAAANSNVVAPYNAYGKPEDDYLNIAE